MTCIARGRKRWQHEAEGQSTLEYLGLVLLVAAIVIALLALGLGPALVNGIERAICRVTSGPSAACGPAPTVENPLTPLERSTRGDYVALGDSYSSGEGGSKFAPGTDHDGGWKESLDGLIPLWDHKPGRPYNMCHRSTEAYSQRIYDRLEFEGDLKFHACSGAEIKDMRPDNQDDNPGNGKNPPDHENAGELPQLKHLDEDTSLVTLSIGGNDAGFADVIKSCFWRGIKEYKASCEQALGEDTRRRIRNLEDDLVQLYNEIQRRTPNARVIVVGYPRMFPDEPGLADLEVGPSLGVGDLDEPIDPADQKWLNEMARLLNDTIRKAAREAGVEYVDVYNALDGHEIGTKNSWINDVDLELENGGIKDMGSFHPNDRGQKAIAKRVEKQIRSGR